MEDFGNLFNEMKQLFETFETEHQKFVEKGNASAGTRARNAINQIKKLITPYKKQSVDLAKKNKKTKSDQ